MKPRGPEDEKEDGGVEATPEPYCMRCGSPIEDLPQGCKSRCPVCDFPYPQGSCSD